MEEKQPLLEISDLSVSFRMYDGSLEQRQLQVISSLSLTVYPGEILAVAGSSGSGKSLLAAAILGILPANAAVGGAMRYGGQPLTPERQRSLRGGGIALVPQSVAYLDPLMKVGRQADGHQKPRPTAKRRELFRRFGLPEKTERLYPFQLSGGMARRVLVSTALLSNARLVIADEPTPGMSLDQAKEALRHPYSRALWSALPQNGFTPIDGFQPYAGSLPAGCLFAPRCPLRTAACEAGTPPMRDIRGGEVRCIHAT